MSSNAHCEDGLAHVLFSWQKKNDQELDITAGDIVTVLSITPDRQWVLCASPDNDRGYVPYDHLQLVENSSSRSTVPVGAKDDSGYLHPKLPSSLQQPAAQPAVVQQLETHQTSARRTALELQTASNISESDGNTAGAAQQQPQDQEDATSLSVHSAGGYESVSSDSSYSLSSLGYETDGGVVCYRVKRQPDSKTKRDDEALDVSVGDLVLTSEETSGDLVWGCRCADPSSQGYVHKSLLQTASSLDQQPWFLGKMTRGEVESLLLKPNIETGTFIVRQSETTTGYVISIKSLEGTQAILRHRKCHEMGGKYTAWSQIKFHDIPELIKYHSDGRELSIPYDKTSIRVTRNSLQRPTVPPPQPPVSNYRAAPNFSSLVSHFEAKGIEQNAPTSVPPPLKKTQVSVRSLGVSVLAPRTNSVQQPISLPNAGQGLAPPKRSSSVLHMTATQRDTGAIPKVASRNLVSPQPQTQGNQSAASTMPLPTPLKASVASLPANQNDIRVMELEDRVVESELESWRVIRLEKIGSGHYGEVWKAKIKNTKRIVALKTFNKERMEEKLFLAEAKTMMALRHPNLVKLHGVCSEPQNVFMLLDLHSFGSVYDYLSKGHTLSPNEKLNVLKGVLSGMKYLSEEGFVHRDLAARNVLMADDKTPKVADFGLAQMIKADGRAEHDNQKTPWKWTAPEAMCGGNLWTSKCDVWSFGVFCWELYSNCATQPYPDINNSLNLLHYLRAGDRLNRPPDCNSTIFGFVYQCWEFDYKIRASFQDLWNFFKA